MDMPPTFAIAAFGSSIHWIILLVIALLLFGRRLPEILRGVGGSIGQFRKGVQEGAGNLDIAGQTKAGAESAQAKHPVGAEGKAPVA